MVSHLRDVLARRCGLHVVVARDGERLRPGSCYVGEPARHLTIGADGRIHLLHDRVYRGRTIDALFQSLAEHAGPRTIGIVLSGELDDGTRGLAAIKAAGGIALVQSPTDALAKSMPQNALHYDGPVDVVGSVHRLAEAVVKLTSVRGPQALLLNS
jgi:chemotaxis response regulator CheB